MYYVFGTKEFDGSLTYYKDPENNTAIFNIDSLEEAQNILDTVLSAVNSDLEVYVLLPATAKLCEC